MALGDLYFDVLLRDKTDQGINAIKNKLSNLGANIDIKLNNASIPKIDVTASLAIDRNKLIADVQDALKSKQFTIDIKATSNITTNANKSTLAYETEAQAKLIGAQARLLNAQNAQAVASAKAALAQAKLATEHQKTAREANRAQIEATKLARQRQMLANATNKAAQSTRAYNNANRGAIGSLREMTGLAGKFSAIYMGGQFLSSLIKIRGEFEMQLVSLRAIMQSTERANELYGQLMQLSVISPFQFGDLVKYAKQLSAYQIPMGDLYDTTKRLADLSAGLGVGMDRLILAYGQVRSASVLRGTELRQFTEAGIPMVGALADKFSELEGRVVSAGEVFDKISGREVPFEMVKEVLEDLTSEGGMFFEMQEKQAQTLQGQISNLKDAYAIMMNEIGQSTDGILKGGVGAIRWSLQNYQELLNILLSVMSAYGAYRIQLGYKTAIVGKDTMATLQNALAEKKLEATRLESVMLTRTLTPDENKLIDTRHRLTYEDYNLMVAEGKLNAAQVKNLFLTGKITKEQFKLLATSAGMQKNYIASIANMTTMQRIGERLSITFAGVGDAFKTLGATMMASWPMLLIGVITQLIMKFSQLGEAQDEVNKEIAENAKQTLADLESFFNSHKVVIDNIEVGDITEENAKKFVEKAIEKIDQVSPTESLALSLKADILGGDDVTEQAKRAEKALKNVRDVLQDIQSGKFEWEFPDYLVEDDLFEDMKNLAQAIKDAKTQNWDMSGQYLNFDKTDWGKETAAFEVYEEASKAFWKNLPKIQSESLEEQRIAVANFYKALQELANKEGVSKEAMGYVISMYDSWFNKHLEGLDDWSASWTHIMQNMTSEDLNRLREIDGNWSESNTKKAQDIFDKTAKSLNMVYREAAWTAERISQLQAFINVKLNIESSGQLTGLQQELEKTLGSYTDADNKKSVLSLFSGSGYASLVKDIDKNLKETRDKIRDFSNINEASAKELKNLQAQETMLTTLQGKYGKPTETRPTSSRPRGRGTTPVDQATLNLKEQYKKYKDLIAEYEKLKKLVGSEKALTTLKSVTDFMPLFMGEGADEYINKILSDGGKIALIEDYLKKIQGKTSKEAKSFGEELGGALRDAQLEDFTDKFEESFKRIADAVEVNVEKFKEWETIYEKVGNKDMASLLAFGDAKKMYSSLSDIYKNGAEEMAFVSTGKKYTFAEMLGMSTEDFDKTFSPQVKEIFQKAKDAIASERSDLFSSIAESAKNTMSIDEQIKQLETTRDKKLAEINKLDIDEGQKQEFKNIITQDYANQISKLNAKVLELLPTWNKIFNPEAMGYNQVKKLLDISRQMIDNATFLRETPEGDGIFVTSFTDLDGANKTTEITSERLKDLREQYAKLAQIMAQKNPFKALADFIKLLNGDESDGEDKPSLVDGFIEGIERVQEVADQLGGTLSDIFSASGADELAKAISSVTKMLSGLANVAKNFATKDWVSGVVSLIATLGTAIAEAFSNEWVAEWIDWLIQRVQNQTEGITRAMGRALGKVSAESIEATSKVLDELIQDAKVFKAIVAGHAEGTAYYSKELAELIDLQERVSKGDISALYEVQLKNLEKELSYLKAQERELLEDKNVDKEAIEDIRKEQAELEDQIRYFAEDTLKDLMEIDLKDWASQIGDSLVDAFANGEDAAAAFDKTVGDLMKNVVKNMASLYILEPLFKELETYLFGTDGEGGVFGRDRHFSEEDLKGMMPYLDAIKNEGVPAVEELFKGIDTGLGGLLSMSANMEGLSGGIKSITEDTANLLASYLNAVRADVALIAMANPRMTTIAESQLTQLTLIATNTSRSAVAVEAINNLLRSVTTTTSSGRVLKV